jgi:hypothetical protein
VFFLAPEHRGGGCPGRFLVLSCLAMLYLVSRPSHVGADVDGLAYSLHYPTACGSPTRGLCCLIGVVLSRRSIVGGGPFPTVRSPWVWIFDVVLTV